jgi:hypothetical protein
VGYLTKNVFSAMGVGAAVLVSFSLLL